MVLDGVVEAVPEGAGQRLAALEVTEDLVPVAALEGMGQQLGVLEATGASVAGVAAAVNLRGHLALEALVVQAPAAGVVLRAARGVQAS